MSHFIVENFGPIVKANVKVEGITTLHGESNAGKSSFLKAIHAAIHNRFVRGQVRHGEEATTVKLKWTPDGEVLSVKRFPEGSPLMKLGKHTFSKLGRSVPVEVEEFNNMGVLKVADDMYSLNFNVQFQKPLLLEYSQKKVVSILSASKGLEDWNTAHAELKDLREQNRGSFNTVDTLLTKAKENTSLFKEQLAILKSPMKKLRELQVQYLELDANLECHGVFFTHVEKVKEIEQRTKALSKVLKVTEDYDKNLLDVLELVCFFKACRTIEFLELRVRLAEVRIDTSEKLVKGEDKLFNYKLFLRGIDRKVIVYSRIDFLSNQLKKLIEIKDVESDIESKQLQLDKLSLYLQSVMASQPYSKKIEEIETMIKNRECPTCRTVLPK